LDEKYHQVRLRNEQKGLIVANLDKFELDILKSVENKEWDSKGNITERTRELQSIIKHQKKKQFL